MVNVLVRYKDVVDVVQADVRRFQAPQNFIAAAAVHEKAAAFLLQDEAGVVAFGDQRIAGAEHGEPHGFIPFCDCTFQENTIRWQT
jgi:hypothetical protein